MPSNKQIVKFFKSLSATNTGSIRCPDCGEPLIITFPPEYVCDYEFTHGVHCFDWVRNDWGDARGIMGCTPQVAFDFFLATLSTIYPDGKIGKFASDLYSQPPKSKEA